MRRGKTILDEDEKRKHDFDFSDIKTINDKVKRERIQSNRVLSSNKTIEFEILSRYAAEWFGSVWVLTLGNQTDVGLIPLRSGVVSVWFGSDFYRFETGKKAIYRMFLYVECFYI